VGGSLYLQIGSHNLTLTASTSGSGSGVYQLPVSASNPLVITFAEVENFVQTISTALGTGNLSLPTTFPNGTPTSSASLSIQKLAVDTVNGLFSLQVSLSLGTNGWTPFPGLTIQGLGLSVLRTNGRDQL